MKTLLIGVAFAGASAATEPNPALYSFTDVFRLTVAGPIAGPRPLDTAPDAPIRVAVAQARTPEPRFTVSPLPQPDKWLLILAGVALAGWVAHRRLVHTL